MNMESSITPAKTVTGDVQNMDHSISKTPKPQATSTVNRRGRESLPAVITKETAVPSPSYLLNAIDGMRVLTDQLGSLRGNQAHVNNLPFPGGHQIRKAASVAELSESRRGSGTGESEANSSLGILKLDEFQEFSEPEYDAANLSEIMAKFRKEYSLHTLLEKENVPDPLSSELSFPRFDASSKVRHPGGDISAKVLNSERESLQSQSIQADVKLRLQKALAQKALERSSMDSCRLSQLNDNFLSENLSVGDNCENTSSRSSKDSMGAHFSNLEQTPSPMSNATFGGGNFMSFSGSPAALDSSENFQPADMAMDRLKQDEKSWRQHFGDLPVLQDPVKIPTSNSDGLEHLTQNLDLSTMSGIAAGEVTVSSSIMGDVGKRRLSMGEYFKLHTQQLGDKSEDYFNSLKSPSKRRPHPPLVNMNSSDISVDQIPTRDSGLNRSLNSSFPESLDFSMRSDLPAPKLGETASRSMDLMPPPPPRARPSLNVGKPADTRDSVSTRLSMSFSIPRDTDDSVFKDLNSSSLSLDSGEKFVSISQMVKIMQELPEGKKSARQLVDDFMKRCQLSEQQARPRSPNHEGRESLESCDIGSPIASNRSNSRSHVLKSSLVTPSDDSPSPSRNQRVKDWVTAINNSGSDSVYASEPEDRKTLNKVRITSETLRKGPSHHSKSPSRKSSVGSVDRRSLHEVKASEGRKNGYVKKEDNDDDDVSVASSFMPPPAKAMNPAFNHLRNFSTPKVTGRQIASLDPTHRRTSASSLAADHQRTGSSSQISNKTNLSHKFDDLEAQKVTGDDSSGKSQKSHSSYKQSTKFSGSYDKTLESKISSQSSSSTLKSFGYQSNSDTESKTQTSNWKHHTAGVPRPPSNCGSTRSATSCAKSSSKHTDIGSGPLQIDSTHTQLSWASIAPGSSVTQTFALRNKSLSRVRLVVYSPNAAFKLMGERGEILSELLLTLHSEETRRIHVMFSPISTGSVVGKLVISRSATSESGSVSLDDRRLIALYGYGGMAELSVEGASKDRWAQLFLNMCMSENDIRSEMTDVDLSNDAPQMVSSFSVRNHGKIPAFISVQIAGELPFVDCGVYVSPKDLCLMPGEVGRILVRFDPGRDILQWLNKNADDMQLLANIWLSWSELATWQRIRRLYMKYYKGKHSGPLSTWGTLYTGEVGVGHELKDNRSSESALAQAVRRLKVAVLVEREKLNLFDMDATMVFDMLVANETAMFNSPQLNERTLDSSEYLDSPIISAAHDGYLKIKNESSVSTPPNRWSKNHVDSNSQNDLVVVTSESPREPQVLSLEFPPTTSKHKSKVKITFQNPSAEKSLVCLSDPSPPFSISTSKVHVPAGSYVSMSVLFRPTEPGIHHSTLYVLVDGNKVRSYLLQGEGVHE